MPGVELPVERPGWFFKPGIKLDHTRYELEDMQANQPANPYRTLSIAKVDMGLNFERLMNGSGRVQTLEPRILYVNVPFTPQDARNNFV